MHCSDRQGFTLIELLVVIAIIAILAAILFPVFIAAKERGKIGACSGHQKQLIAAFLRYSDDWDGMTCVTYDAQSAPNGKHWAQRLYPYTTKNPNIFYCPSLKNKKSRSEMDSGASFSIMSYVSIGLNIAVGDIPGGTTSVKLTSFGSPGKTLIFACSSLRNYEFYEYHDRTLGAYFVSPGRRTEPLLCLAPEIKTVVDTRQWDYNFFDPDRHNGLVVVAHLDGHVKVYTQKWILTPHGDPSQFKTPNFSIWDRY